METDHSGISDDVVTGKPRAASKNQSYSLVGGCCRGNYRYIFLFIMIFFNANLYICRNCIAEAVVWMYGDSQGRPTPALTEHGPILTAGFYFGYPVFQLFAGHFSGAYGAKPVIQCGVTFWCIVTILVVPVYWSSIGPDAALNPDYSATVFPVLICRVLVGMFEGLALPAQVVLFRRWLPPEELSTGNSLAKAGECCGCILVMGSYPLLAASYGWEAIMYVSGGFGLVWFAVFSVFVSSVPEQCRFVGKDEAAMIVAAREAETATSTTNNAQNSRPIGADPYPPSSDSSDEEERNASMSDVEQAELPLLTTTRSAPRDEEVLENQASRDATPKEPNTGLCSLPWTEILTNLPYISVVLVHISHNWAMFLFMSQLPTFLKTQYPTMTDETRSLYSMVPYVTVTIAAFIAGPIADFFIKAEYAHAKKCTSTIYDVRAGVTRIRKFLTFLAEVPQACTLMLISLPVIQESAFATMALVTLGRSLYCKGAPTTVVEKSVNKFRLNM